MAHARAAMFRRQVYKHQKTVFVVLFYLTVYFLISCALNTTETTITFVSDHFRISDRYIYMFLVAPQAPVFSDADSADVFSRCGRCILTNNKGFMPLREYDAVLVVESSILTQDTKYDLSKVYSFKSSSRCLKTKFKGCINQPMVTSLITKDAYDLCSLCETLTKKKLKL